MSAVYKKVGRYGLHAVKGDDIEQSLMILLGLTLLRQNNFI